MGTLRRATPSTTSDALSVRISARLPSANPRADAIVLSGQVNGSIALGAGQPNETTITSVEGVDHGGPALNSAWIAAYDWGASSNGPQASYPDTPMATVGPEYSSDFDDAGSIYVAIRANVYPGALTLKSADGTTLSYAPPLDTEWSSYGIAKLNASGVWQWYAPLEPDTGTGGGTYVRLAAVSVHSSRVYVTGVAGVTQTGRSLRFSNQGGITFPVSDYPVHPMIILDANTGAYVGHQVDGVSLAGPEAYVTRHVPTTTPTVGAAGVTGWYDGSTGFGRHMNVAVDLKLSRPAGASGHGESRVVGPPGSRWRPDMGLHGEPSRQLGDIEPRVFANRRGVGNGRRRDLLWGCRGFHGAGIPPRRRRSSDVALHRRQVAVPRSLHRRWVHLVDFDDPGWRRPGQPSASPGQRTRRRSMIRSTTACTSPTTGHPSRPSLCPAPARCTGTMRSSLVRASLPKNCFHTSTTGQPSQLLPMQSSYSRPSTVPTAGSLDDVAPPDRECAG